MGLAENADLVARLSLKDSFSGPLGKAEGRLKSFNAATKNIQGSLSKTAQNLERLAKVGIVAVGGALIGAIKVAGDFEASLNTINTIAQTNAAGLDKIGDAIRKVARDTGTSLDDLTAGYYDLLSAGIKAADATNVLTQANTLAIGGIGTTAETIDLLTTAINAYGGDASKAAQYTDDFAKAIELGKVKASEIAASFADVGAIAAQNGIALREVAESYAFLTSQGINASEVTTQMSRAILELLKPSTTLAALQKKLGTNYAELAKTKGLVPALEQLRIDATKAGIPLVELFGRVEGFKFLLETTGANFAGFSNVISQFGDDAGTAARQMAERQQGLNFQLARLKARALDAGITVGSKLLPKIVPLVDKLNQFIGKNQDKIGAFGDKLASGFTKFADAISTIDFSGLVAGLQLTGRVAKTVVDAFLSLPPDVQKLAITALAVNKVGGGIVTSGIKDLSGLILRGLAGGGGGILGGVQKVFVVNMGVGGLGGGGVPGGGGLIGTAAKIILPVALIAAAVNEIEISRNNPERFAEQLAKGPSEFGPRTAAQMANLRALLSNANQILGMIAYREQRLGEITGGASDIATAKANQTIEQLERNRLQRPPIVNVAVYSTLSVTDVTRKLTVRQTYRSGMTYQS